MKTQLYQLSSWFILHRSQLQVVLFVLLLSLALIALAAPGVIVFADNGPGPGGG
jgi:hypothetical protein